MLSYIIHDTALTRGPFKSALVAGFTHPGFQKCKNTVLFPGISFICCEHHPYNLLIYSKMKYIPLDNLGREKYGYKASENQGGNLY